MALATRCPGCSTVFRISTAQAAAKGGMVRCGVCSNVFNSLDALVRVEDLDVVEEVIVEPGKPARPERGAGAAAPASKRSPPDDWSPLSSADAETVFVSRDDAAEPAVGLDLDHTVVSAWWLPDARDEHISRAGPIAAEKEAETGARNTGGERNTGARRSEPHAEPSLVAGTNPVHLRPDPVREPTPRALRWTLAILSLLATVALLAQLAYLGRDELAVRYPPSRPWLVEACQLLGCNVGHPIHSDAITIESASVQTTGASSNVYVLTALLRNRDVVDVRYPHLELVLTDLQDQPILRRDLRPEDFVLVTGRTPASGFPAQSELPIRIAFELNNLRFAGYRLNQFYP